MINFRRIAESKVVSLLDWGIAIAASIWFFWILIQSLENNQLADNAPALMILGTLSMAAIFLAKKPASTMLSAGAKQEK